MSTPIEILKAMHEADTGDAMSALMPEFLALWEAVQAGDNLDMRCEARLCEGERVFPALDALNARAVEVLGGEPRMMLAAPGSITEMDQRQLDAANRRLWPEVLPPVGRDPLPPPTHLVQATQEISRLVGATQDPGLTPRQAAIKRGDIVIGVEIESEAGMAYSDYIVSGGLFAMVKGKPSSFLEFEASSALFAAVQDFCKRLGLEG